MVVEEIMTKNPVTAESTSTIGEVASALYELDVRHLPIVSDGELVGIVSDRDLRGFASFDPSSSDAVRAKLSAPVSTMMSGDVLSLSPEADVGDAIDMLLEHRVGAIPVVLDDGSNELLGIVSYVDILRALRDLV